MPSLQPNSAIPTTSGDIGSVWRHFWLSQLGKGLLLKPSGWRPGMQLNVPQNTRHLKNKRHLPLPPTSTNTHTQHRMIWPKISIVLRLRNHNKTYEPCTGSDSSLIRDSSLNKCYQQLKTLNFTPTTRRKVHSLFPLNLSWAVSPDWKMPQYQM